MDEQVAPPPRRKSLGRTSSFCFLRTWELMETTTLLCQYSSKLCCEPRSVKESGELHRLCAQHRAKANEAQYRWYYRHHKGEETVPVRPKRRCKVSINKPRKNRQKAVSTNVDITDVVAVQSPLPNVELSTSPTCDALSDEDLALLNELFLNVEDLEDIDSLSHAPRLESSYGTTISL